MIGLLKALANGDGDVSHALTVTGEYWAAFFEEHAGKPVDQMAEHLSEELMAFELLFSRRTAMAHEAMAPTALLSLYDDRWGFGEPGLAVRVAKAFLRSHMPPDVIASARRAATIFELDALDTELASLVDKV